MGTLLARAKARATDTVEWLLDNGMVLSLHNSMFIVQATRDLRRARNIPQKLSKLINGSKLESVESAKLLEMTLNKDMTWEHHLWGTRDHRDE